MSAISKRVVREFRDKEFRDEYVSARVKRWIASQIKTLRTSREWSQDEFADKLGTAQSNVSRMESVDYGKFTLQTLLEVAAAFDVALQVRFVDHMTFLTATSDVSTDRLVVSSYPKVEKTLNRVFGGEGARLSVVVRATSEGGAAGKTTDMNRVPVNTDENRFPFTTSLSTVRTANAQII